MSGWAVAGAALAAFIIWTAVVNARERHRQRRLAQMRPPLSNTQFISRLVNAGVEEGVAQFVWEESVFYYFEPLKPDPNDRWEGTMRIDPEDLEDITAKFWRRQGWKEPSRKDPVMVPADPTLLEYSLWLDQQRKAHK